MQKFANPRVAKVFASYPPKIRKKLLALRELIFGVASKSKEIGKLEEVLKWGEPSYLTSQTESGSLIRIDQKRNDSSHYAIYFHCQTNLIETFKELFPNIFIYEKNRAIVFDEKDRIPIKELRMCISLALTYKLKKARKTK